jgi:NAD(P)-dependent dehydrogenase (short-subunit alcohol dehydrogenase family)
MQNKIVLITGANAGIGKATAEGLAGQGAKVIMACRKKENGDLAKAEIQKQWPKAELEVVECNLASFQSVKNAANHVLQNYDRIDVLINNAGLFTSNKKMTEDGIEMQFGVNHLGHFLLTKLLLPLIEKSSYPKIINVSSVAHLHGIIYLDSIKE